MEENENVKKILIDGEEKEIYLGISEEEKENNNDYIDYSDTIDLKEIVNNINKWSKLDE